MREKTCTVLSCEMVGEHSDHKLLSRRPFGVHPNGGGTARRGPPDSGQLANPRTTRLAGVVQSAQVVGVRLRLNRPGPRTTPRATLPDGRRRMADPG